MRSELPLDLNGLGTDGVIIGKALYEGALDLPVAIAVGGDQIC